MQSTVAVQTMPTAVPLDDMRGHTSSTNGLGIKAFLFIEGALDVVKEVCYAASRLLWVDDVQRLMGPYDLVVAVRVPDLDALEEVVQSLRTLDSVIRVIPCPSVGEVWS